ncbi:MAG TPA: GNAT family N-acetyltransferase [Rhizomicrobium sp.]|nr:GNAT family N-acetyltransferase [Rhizomicrobium sp.]
MRPLLLNAKRDGEVVGAAILVPRTERRRAVLKVRQLHFNSTGDPAFDCITIEHNDFVACADAQRELWPAFLGWFARQTEVDELVVPGIADGATDEAPRGLLHSVTPMTAFACELPPGGRDAILARLSANSRQQLRRNFRDCEALGPLRIEVATSVVEALAWFTELKALHVASWTRRGRRHAFHFPFFEIFHRALIDADTPEGRVRMRRISAGAHVLGYLYDFRRQGHVCAYQSGFGGVFADLRPGYVSHLLAMEQDAREGMQTYDFLGGENRLKTSLKTERYDLCSYRFARPGPGLFLESAARATRKRFGV